MLRVVASDHIGVVCDRFFRQGDYDLLTQFGVTLEIPGLGRSSPPEPGHGVFRPRTLAWCAKSRLRDRPGYKTL